jgi:hypothetical protein
VPLTLAASMGILTMGAVAPALAVAPSAAQGVAAHGVASATTDSGIVRTITKNATLHFPAATAMGQPSGVQAPEIRREGAGEEGSGESGEETGPLGSNLKPPVVNGSPVGGSAGLVDSWLGLDGFDQRFANDGNQFSVEPPDQALCTGGGYVLEAVNTVLRVYRSSGAPASAVTDLNTFYGYPAQIDRTTGEVGPFVTDPTCIFDHGSGRFYLVVLTIEVEPVTGEFTGPNHLDLAVSRTSNPTGQWDIFRLPVQDDGTQGTPRHTDCPCIGDYPHIGSDANAIFLTTNEYPFTDDPGRYGNNFNGAQIYVVDKAALARGAGSVRVVQFENTSLASGNTRVPGFTVWPAQVPDSRYDTSSGGTEYLLGSIAGEEAQPTRYTGMADQIGVYAISNTSSIRSASPSLRLQRTLVRSEVYGDPPPAEQKAGPVPLRDCILVNCDDLLGPGVTPPRHESEGPIATNDSRMQQVYYSGGMLYGALTTVMRVDGARQAGIAWFAVDPGSSVRAATVARQGYLGVAGNNVIFPAIAVLPDGTGAMVFTLVGSDYYPTAAYARFADRRFGAVQVSALGRAPQDGFSEYKAFLLPGEPLRPRWGDYSAAVTDGSRIFMATEYIQSRCTFAQYRTDMTCGGTRAPLINWATRISLVNP